MKNLLKLFFGLLIVVFAFMPNKAEASHLAGAQITYVCLGGNSYEITLTFYRDCSGVSAPSAATIQFACSSNPVFNFSASLPSVSGTGQEVTPGCSAIPTTCAGGNGYGLQEYVYQAVVTLPPCNIWTMSYNMCCRNPSNTISGSSSAGAYVEAKLNNAQAPCNSSPQFTNLPVTVACVGQTWCYNHGAVDPDGDSLSYTLVAPWDDGPSGPTVYVTYVGGYSATQPLPSNPPVTLNAVTGDICMTPTNTIIAPVAVLVEEWREINGVMTKIGHVYRDMQINVVTCNNQLPQIGGMDFTLTNGYNPLDTLYYHEMCLGPTISFNIWGHDADTFNSWTTGSPEIFDITWNSGIPNGNFTTYNSLTDSAYANFTWTPTGADVSNTPKCFTATITDEACPYNGNQTYSYCIVVRGMLVDLGDDTLLCAGESFTIHADHDTTTVNYIWDIDGSPAGLPPTDTLLNFNSSTYSAGLHFVAIETDDGGTTTQCPGRDTVWVNVVDQPNVDLGKDTAFCAGGSITLDAGPGGMFQWNTGATTQTLLIDSTGVYYVYVDGYASNFTRCNDTDTITVNVAPIPVVDLGSDTCSDTPPVTIFAGNDPNIFNYTWLDAAGNPAGNTNNITVTSSSEYSVVVSAKANSSCNDDDTKVVNIIQGDKINAQMDGIDLGSGPQTMCSHQEMILTGPQAPTGHSYAYIWTDNGIPFGTSEVIVLNDIAEGTHSILLDVGGGCVGTMEITVAYCELDIPNVITPDGNGINDVFKIDGLEYYPGSEMAIYDRWGSRVFHSTNYQPGGEWNPKDNNNSDGVYYYIFKIADDKGTEKSGTLTVISK